MPMRVPVVLAVILTASAASAKPPKLDSQAAIVMDVAGGTDVLTKHADDERPIGSMTKIFVALVLREHDLDLTA